MKVIRVDSIYREVPLGRGHVAIVDAADYELVMESGPWFALPCSKTVYALSHRRVNGKRTTQRLHQLLLPGHQVIDHRNGDGWDNRRSNLRPTTVQMNNANKMLRKDNTSGFKGVYFQGRRQAWRAMIRIDGKLRSMGTFRSPEDAARAYDEAARAAFGDFAALNFPGPGERSALVAA